MVCEQYPSQEVLSLPESSTSLLSPKAEVAGLGPLPTLRWDLSVLFIDSQMTGSKWGQIKYYRKERLANMGMASRHLSLEQDAKRGGFWDLGRTLSVSAKTKNLTTTTKKTKHTLRLKHGTGTGLIFHVTGWQKWVGVRPRRDLEIENKESDKEHGLAIG